MEGVIHRIEEKIGHRVMWLIGLLHTNQLPWRHLFTNLDRRTGGKDSFSGAGACGVISSDLFIIITNRTINCMLFLLV